MTRRHLAFGLLLAAIVGAAGLFFQQQHTVESTLPPVRLGPVRIAASTGTTGALIWAAADRGLFEQTDIAVDVKGFSFGKLAMDALVNGEAELGITAEYVVANMVTSHPYLRIIATVAIPHDITILARKDSAIAGPADLAGKRLGVTLGSNTEYLVDRLLARHSIDTAAVQRINLAPPAMADALDAHKVDAVIVWQPHVQALLDRFGENLVTFDGQPGQDYYFVLVGRAEWLDRHREETRRILSAAKKAEKWASSHPDEFLAYLRDKGFARAAAQPAELAAYRYTISLPTALVTVLSEERRWLRNRGGNSDAPTQDTLDLIDPGPLRVVAPQAVTVTR